MMDETITKEWLSEVGFRYYPPGRSDLYGLGEWSIKIPGLPPISNIQLELIECGQLDQKGEHVGRTDFWKACLLMDTSSAPIRRLGTQTDVISVFESLSGPQGRTNFSGDLGTYGRSWLLP